MPVRPEGKGSGLKQQFTVGEDEKAIRIDKYLSEQCPDISRSYLQKLLKAEAVFVGGKPVKSNYKTAAGDLIELEVPEAVEPEIVPEEMELDILYEDSDIILINKPKGMVVHPAAGHYSGTLVNGLMAHCRADLSGINGVMRPGIVHRIDKDTSGLLVVAKNDSAHHSLAAQIAAHTAYRGYEAIVVGSPREDSGTVDKPIARHKTDRKRMAIVEGGREAITHYTVLKRYRGYTHMAFQLETGRTHQIRVHMASIGHPIIGDPVYGLKKDRFSDIGGQCLHAAELTLTHPKTGERMTFSAALPDYFVEILQKRERMQ